jgi:hypothetical protein
MTPLAIVAAAANLMSVGIEAISAAQTAVQTLRQAQDEQWAPDDPRWAGAFDAADTALNAAIKRLT